MPDIKMTQGTFRRPLVFCLCLNRFTPLGDGDRAPFSAYRQSRTLYSSSRSCGPGSDRLPDVGHDCRTPAKGWNPGDEKWSRGTARTGSAKKTNHRTSGYRAKPRAIRVRMVIALAGPTLAQQRRHEF